MCTLSAHTKVYGMVKILSLYEILKFYGRDFAGSEIFDSRARTGWSFEVKKYMVRNGKISMLSMQEEEIVGNAATDIMSVRDVAEIIFRRRDGDTI